MTPQQLLDLISQGESASVEFKSSFQKEAIETLSAFANTRGGQVLLGVSDGGHITGVTVQAETVQSWVNQCKQITSPRLIPDIDLVDVAGKTVAVVSMAEHPVKPVSCRGRYFTRTGNPQREERWDYPMHALTVEKIKSGQYKSHLRNKQIATIFHELNLIEKYGSGVRRVIDSFVAYGLPEPTFEATQGGLAVTVYKASSPQSGGVSGGVNSAAANLEAQLLVLVQNTPGLNAVGLSHQTNTPLRTVQRQLKQLTAKGLLAFKGAPKTGGYWPTPLPNACEDKK